MVDLSAPVMHELTGRRLWMAATLEGENPAAWLAGGAGLLEKRTQESGGGRVLGKGRGATRALTVGGFSGVWRHNRHGGLMRDVLGDRYLSSVRLAREIALSHQLRCWGVATPEVLLAFAERRRGWVRQDLVTEEVVGAVTIFEAREDEDALAAADALLEQVFELGLWATDLHPANLLWQADSNHPEGGMCWLIDLAGAAMRMGPLRPQERIARRARFARYFQKHAGMVPTRFQA
ncbi:MAG: hypothetical protein MK209_05655 [Planctomycetes bacterium]|nr:hypothetical protein [Planctomycetota bacterium]